MDQDYAYELLTKLVQGRVAEYPGLPGCSIIGRSGEGWNIWAVTLTNRATGPAR